MHLIQSLSVSMQQYERQLSQAHFRQETDLLGIVDVPEQALFGAQTQRAVQLYPLMGEKRLFDYPDLLHALLRVKKVAALTNKMTSELNDEYAEAIIEAIEHLLAGLPLEQFPVHAFHGGGGISTNMNVNEVIANLANLRGFAQPAGSYHPLNPNDHVNLNHSTSDALSTACHIAIIEKWPGLETALLNLEIAFKRLGQDWRHVPKLARTCMQDAVEISFENFFSGYCGLLQRNHHKLNELIGQLYQVNLGGNIIGRQSDCSNAFFDLCLIALKSELGSDKYSRATNLFDRSQNYDQLIDIASQLESLARGLIKIAKDFRLMGSSSAAGFGEIILPAVQPGSSAMPGKVNPTIPEFLVQSCMQTIGHCSAVHMTQDHGELDYNPWQNILITNLLDAMNCIENGVRVFTEHCVHGIQPNLMRNQANIETLGPLMVKLKKLRGYAFAIQAFKQSAGDINYIKQLLNTK